MRSPVKRQMMTTLAIPSIVLSRPYPISATEFAGMPAVTPIAPSAVIHARLSQEISLTRLISTARSAAASSIWITAM